MKLLYHIQFRIVVLVLLSCVFGAPHAHAQVTKATVSHEEWIAKVNGRSISFQDYSTRYNDFILSKSIRDSYGARSAILENMIREELLLHVDRNTKVFGDRAYINDVENANKRAVLAYLKDQEVYARISVSEDELRQTFLRANEKLAARHLYAKTEEEANDLYQRLQQGADFQELARAIFTDSVLQSNGGFVGYFSWGDMDPAFEEAAYALKVGDISPPVETAQGYSIIQLTDRRSHPLLTETQFQQKKSHLRRVLRIRKRAPSERAYISGVFRQDEVSFDVTGLDLLISQLRTRHGSNVESTQHGDLTVTCAAYSGIRLSVGEVLQRISALPNYQQERIRSTEAVRAAVIGMVLQDVLLNIARVKGYDALPVVKEASEKMRRAIFLRHRTQEITRTAEVDRSDIVEYYRLHIGRFSSEREMNVQEIIVADKALADSIKSAIAAGAEFAGLARLHSLRSWSSVNGGVMGMAPASRFGQLEEVLWKSPVGELAGPLEVGAFVGLFRVLEKKESSPLPMDLVQERVADLVRMERQGSIMQDYITGLKRTIRVEVNEQRLRSFTAEHLAAGTE